jgi:carboxynorspermidine decarboxylase
MPVEATAQALPPAQQKPGCSTDCYPWIHTVETPAFVMEECAVRAALAVVDRIRRETAVRVLYALKPSVYPDLLTWIRDGVDGFAASSLYEAMVARQVLGDGKLLSITTPGYRDDQIECIARLCDHVVLNSLPQWERFRCCLRGLTSVGLRINPGLSLVADERFDPCRPQSKLGAPIADIRQELSASPQLFEGLEGLHFHTNCESESFEPLLETVSLVSEQLDPLLRTVRWINLGGGYLLTDPTQLAPLYQSISLLQERYDLTVLLEPGAALVRRAGYLVSTVTDLFCNGDTMIAVLDTTVNHMPEVFEYQFVPELFGDALLHPYGYLLAGASCLAGDLFGEHCFARPLEVGSRILFLNVGAYTFVKSHLFNGINRPALYSLTMDGALQLRRRFDYHDYLRHLGLDDAGIDGASA